MVRNINIQPIIQRLIQYINNQKKFIKSLGEFYGYPIYIHEDTLINQKLYEKIPLINDLIKQNETHHYVPMDTIIIKRLMTMNTIWTQTYNQYKVKKCTQLCTYPLDSLSNKT